MSEIKSESTDCMASIGCTFPMAGSDDNSTIPCNLALESRAMPCFGEARRAHACCYYYVLDHLQFSTTTKLAVNRASRQQATGNNNSRPSVWSWPT